MSIKGTSTTPGDPGDSVVMRWVRDHVTYMADYCLIWPFARSRNGYGTLGRNGQHLYAHRYICELVHGAPPSPGHQCAHSCGRGAEGCVNPLHLSWKTPSENQKDREDRRGRRRTKLTAEQAQEIRDLAGRLHVSAIAERFGITEANVRQIHSGKIWRFTERYDLTDDEVREIRRLSETLPGTQIAKRLGLSQTSVYRVIRRETYGYIPAEGFSLASPVREGQS